MLVVGKPLSNNKWLLTTIGRAIVQARLIVTLVVNAGAIEIAEDQVAGGNIPLGSVISEKGGWTLDA